MKICSGCAKWFDSVTWRCPACGHEPESICGFPSFLGRESPDPGSYDRDYFAQLAKLEEKNFWFRSRNRLILYALERYCRDVRSFFEIGCGTGYVLSAIERSFADVAITGAERYPEALVFASGRLKGRLYIMDALDLPFIDEFDVIGCFDVLEHLDEDSKALEQMYRALRKGGMIILTVPQHPFLWSANDEVAKHVRRYRQRELRVKVGKAGFRIIRLTSFVSLLFPVMLLSRLKRRRTKQESVLSELNQPGFLNAFLERAFDLERLFIRAGFNFPFGGSLLLIAEKI